ncbi:MAG: 3-oxoacyl-ACP reductase [Sulfobacillus acidophilus]|uniref:3-oxoacyl-ACP reductase n=1 Tax=Sulfobacillus acidophilus TaxID=53633 RepID=A0A2T2WHC9_9FIRM|nr:MAG: 3-oxoacyl-ACP reductase [Sulfobacillus acidophilus]
MELGLAGKVALVTGAGQGIGRVLGLYLAREGVRVAFHYHDSREGAQSAVEAVQRDSGKGLAIGCDLRDLSGLSQLVADVEKTLGPVDVLVNNAAWTPSHPFLESTPSDYAREFEVTVFATMELTRVVIQRLLEHQRGGSIITIAGDAGRIGESRLAVTAAARAAEMAFAKSIAKEFGRHQIRSNVISLGLVDKGDGTLHFDSAQIDRLVRMYPLRRLGKPDDVAPLVGLLASDQGSWITGQVISVNGGYAMV